MSSRISGQCPICKRPTLPDFKPFCSRHCADVDLAKWLTGAYALPVLDEDDIAPEPPGD